MNAHPSAPRGFIIVVVLAMAAVITAIVAAQLSTSQKAQVTGIRVEEEVRARAIAEGCLEMLTSYIDRSQAAAGPGADFDSVLAGPNGAFDDADDYLPFDARVVVIPGSASALAADAERRKHQWSLIDIPGSGGACAARFDDNSDDARGDLVGVPPEAGEGGGVDVPNRDRDLSVYVTTIGLYPLLAGTDDDDAYARAHARVTLRRLVQRENVVQPREPALWASNTVELFDNNDVCGPGGVRGDNVTLATASCACGIVEGSLSGTGIPAPGDTCSCPTTPCTPATPSNVGAQPDPPASVHFGSPETRLANEAWGVPLRANPTAVGGEGVVADPLAANDVGAAANPTGEPICTFFLSNDGDFYVWDRKDTDARTSITALSASAGASLPGLPAVIDCTSVATDPLPAPCEWDLTTDTLSCPVSATQACWKLMARLDGNPGQDIGLGTTPQIEHTSAGTDEIWDPKRVLPIPNIAGGQSFSNAVTPALQLCGSATSCQGCDTALGANANAALEWNDGADSWQLTAEVTNDDLPHPAVFVSEAPGPIIVDSDNVFLNVTIVAASPVTLQSSVCCATCDCTRVDDGDLAGGCVLDAPFGSSTPLGGDASTIALNDENDGIAVKSFGLIQTNANAVIGDLLGRTVTQQGCLVGNLVAFGGGGGCGATGTCTGADACVAGDVIGDVHSMTSLDLTSPVTGRSIWGSLVAKAGVCLQNGVNVAGSVQSQSFIELRNNAGVINTTTGGATPQAANAARRTFMEPTW